jgi:hypothetical protein
VVLPILPAFVLSIIGVIRNSGRKYAIAGMVLSGLYVLFFLGAAGISLLCQ